MVTNGNAARLFQAQSGRCFHCARPMLMSAAAKVHASRRFNDGWTREHLVPLSKGGRRGGTNIVLAHMKCNGRRGNADPTPEMLERARAIWEIAKSISPKEAKQATERRYDLNKPWIHVTRFYPAEDEPKFTPPK